MKSENVTKSPSNYEPTTIGYWARNLRLYLGLSQKEIAKRAKVPQKSVDLLEDNLPIQLDEKRRILRELYAIKASNFG